MWMEGAEATSLQVPAEIDRTSGVAPQGGPADKSLLRQAYFAVSFCCSLPRARSTTSFTPCGATLQLQQWYLSRSARVVCRSQQTALFVETRPLPCCRAQAQEKALVIA